MAVLAEQARSVERAATSGRITASTRATFQATALLVRQLRAEAEEITGARQRTEMHKRIDGVATALARAAARTAALWDLVDDDAVQLPGTAATMQQLRQKAGMTTPAEPAAPMPAAEQTPVRVERQVVPQSVVSRQLANPFLAPDYSAAPEAPPRPRLLADWELIRPLLRAFEAADDGTSACMDLPAARPGADAAGQSLMLHQARVVAAAAAGHRTFLLADEPGLGKTAQALLAAQAADAYPLLVVVPNVVKTSWAREAARWTPEHPAAVVHSDGDNLDAFRDVIIVNYDILDRHAGWLTTFGFRGMVIDEAHFIKNKTSLRSQHVLHLSRRIRERTVRPLLMALTGTPLINDIDDFLAIWEFLGWIDGDQVAPDLLHALERTGLTPSDPGFGPAARTAVIGAGIVRRRKSEVATDIPPRRVADVPVELEGAEATSVRDAENRLTRALLQRYDAALLARGDDPANTEIDPALVRRIAGAGMRDSEESGNIFAMLRRLGMAKAELAADYTAQLARAAGKVVLFARHIDVMDIAEAALAKRGIGYTTLRGEDSTQTRTANIDSFTADPQVQVIVCSLAAAGVGVNLQVASNVVLAELPWTAAEQTQAIDRVHRIGQDQPVTAWRVIAAQTLDARIAELIDAKAGLAAQALDGVAGATADGDIRVNALAGLLEAALADRQA